MTRRRTRWCQHRSLSLCSSWMRNTDQHPRLLSKMVDSIAALADNDPSVLLSVFLVKSKSTSILKKRPLAASNSADSPMINGKLAPEPTSSPVDLHPPPSVSSSIPNPMSPKPSTIQRLQSFFRHTPRKISFQLSFLSTISLPSTSLQLRIGSSINWKRTQWAWVLVRHHHYRPVP